MFALIFVIVTVTTVVLPDVYLWFVLLRRHMSRPWGSVIILPSAVILAGLVCSAAGRWNDTFMRLMFGCLLCVAVPKFVFALVSAPGRGRSATLNALGLMAAAIALAGGAYGFVFGWKRLTVNRTQVTLERLPAAFDGYRVAQISDLHVGTFGRDATFLRSLADSIAALKPDLVVFTGDLVNSDPGELAPFKDELSRLTAPDGMLSVTGNHDYCLYNRHLSPGGAAEAAQRLMEIERAMGWHPLNNTHTAVVRGRDTLYVAGVENTGRPPFPSRGDLERALKGVPPGATTILLSHDPWHWRSEVLRDGRADLMLAGHTHAMQLSIAGHSPAALFAREWGGLYADSGRLLFVCTGTGGNLPFRLGAWPEIALLELRAAPLRPADGGPSRGSEAQR